MMWQYGYISKDTIVFVFKNHKWKGDIKWEQVGKVLATLGNSPTKDPQTNERAVGENKSERARIPTKDTYLEGRWNSREEFTPLSNGVRRTFKGRGDYCLWINLK